MEVYMVTYQYDDASDTSFKGLYATFQDAVDAISSITTLPHTMFWNASTGTRTRAWLRT